jgi:hypothetical protein
MGRHMVACDAVFGFLRLHGLVTWSLASTAIFYFAVTSTARAAGILASVTGARIGQANVSPGLVENITVTAASWMLIAAICGLIGALVGGHAGSERAVVYGEVTETPEIHRAA